MAASVDKKCCVPNCENTRQNDVILHVFPNPKKNLERFEAWLNAIDPNMASLDEDIVFKYRRVCHHHFEAKYYTSSKRLSNNAVPTIKLKATNGSVKNLVACQACLATDCKLYSLDTKLLEVYNFIMGKERIVNLHCSSPKFICNYCSVLLMKYNRFKDTCRNAKEVLEDVKTGDNIITTENTRKKQQLRFNKTAVRLLSINSIGIVTFDNLTHECKTDPLHESISHDPITKRHGEHGLISDTSDITDGLSLKYDTTPNLSVNCDKTKRSDRSIIIEFSITSADDTTKLKSHNNPEDQCVNSNNLKDHTNSSDDTSEYYETIKNNTRNVSRLKSVKKRENNFTIKANKDQFESAYDVTITVLSEDQQMQDVLERRQSTNYLHSPYKCDLCYKGFMDEEILNRHVMSQHDTSRGDVVCKFCNFRYKDRRALNQHLKSHRLKFACRQCSYVSRTTFNAREHFKMHGGQMHQCAQCGKSYEKLTTYLSHMRIHHPSQLVWCDLCGEAFISQFGLNSHKKRAHRDLLLEHPCHTCNTHFASPRALQYHTRTGSCSAVTCVHCGEGFNESLPLRDHLVDQHKTAKIYACEMCGKSFSRESLYSAHYRRKHVNSVSSLKKTRLWVCEVCGKTLPNKCLLLYHQRNHTGEKPYHCLQCPKKFTLKKLLQSHLRVHSTARPYACALCPKTFKGLSALRTHEHMHSEGRVRQQRRK